jgi:RecA-family ATPase
VRSVQFAAAVENELKQQAKANGLSVVRKALTETMTMVEEEKIDFLWSKRIPRSKPTLFDGDPGIGKSYTALAIAAALSNGGALPFDTEPEAPLRSLILSAEDGPADTIKPRLRKLGADMDMIAIPSRSMGLTPSVIDANLIDRMLAEFPAALVIVDPIIAFANQRNTDRASDVRNLLGPLALVAEKHKAALLLIRHLNKATQSKALYRGQGSIDFAAICRSAFVFAQDTSNPERRLMAHSKSSLAGLQPTLEFFIDQAGVFRWGGETSESADEALGTGEPRRDREAKQLDAATRFLQNVLNDGPIPSNRVKEKAKDLGISNATLWRAKEQINIRASKERLTGEWFWRLA